MSNIPFPRMFVHELDIPPEFHSLVMRLNSIYGPGLSIESLLRISASDFSTRQGVGNTNLNRFQALKDLFYKRYRDDYPQLFSLYLAEKITNDSHFFKPALLQKIKECFPQIESYKDLNTISPAEFALYPGVGKKKVQELIQWQSQFPSNKQEISENNATTSQLENYRLSAFYLSPQEDKLLRKLHKTGIPHNEITPSFIIKLRQADMVRWGGFGNTSCKILQTLQSRILKSLKNRSSLGILIPIRFGQSLSLKELCPLIAEDLSNFLSMLSGKDIIIWCARLGYRTEQMTLQEIGDKLCVTRERIRQVSERLNSRFLRGVRVSPDILQQKIKRKTRVDLFDHLRELRSIFHTDNDLIRMLALIANENDRDLVLRFNPIVRRNVLDGFLYWHPLPSKRYEILSFLHDEVGGTDEEVDIYLSAMINAKIIRIAGDNILPLDLGKELAISHILAGFSEGLGWKEIAFKVNKSGICRTKLSLERPDPNLSFSSFVFISENHTYSHIRFFPIGKEQIMEILEDVKSALVNSQHSSLHLMAEYYAKLENPQYDYYSVRHAIRNFGESYDLFFNGKSQSDTVSLYPTPKAISQREAVKRLFLETGTPMSLQEIAKHIKSQSEGHARLYIDELMSNGDVVSIEVNQFQIRENAFMGIDTEAVKIFIRTMISEDRRIHHISIIAHHVNRIYGSDYSNRFWRSFVFAYTGEMGWFVKGMLISMDYIEMRSLIELVRLNKDKTQEDIIATIQEKVCVSLNEIKRAISNEKMKSQDTIESNNEGRGLASDVMEELFLL